AAGTKGQPGGSDAGAASGLTDREVLEAGELANEGQLDDTGRTVALLCHDQLRYPFGTGRRLTLVAVHVLAVDEGDDVGVLLQRARFAEVGQLRTMIRSRLGRAAQLRT